MTLTKNKKVFEPKWNEKRPQQAYELALLGATNAMMATVFECNVQTIDYWMRTKPEFKEAVHRGRMMTDAKVAKALVQCATGYEYYEEHIITVKGESKVVTIKKRVPPNPWAAFKWLSTRQRELWADVHKTETTNTNVNILQVDLKGLSTEELKIIEKLGLQQALQEANGNVG